jgi:hypothetical protein
MPDVPAGDWKHTGCMTFIPRKSRCKGVRHVLENYEIAIRPEELIVGEMAAPPKAVPSSRSFPIPGFVMSCANWPLHEREIGAYRPTNPETVRRALELEEYWKERALRTNTWPQFPKRNAGAWPRAYFS